MAKRNYFRRARSAVRRRFAARSARPAPRRRSGFTVHKAVRLVAAVAGVAIAVREPVQKVNWSEPGKVIATTFIRELADQPATTYVAAMAPSIATEAGIALASAAKKLPKAILG